MPPLRAAARENAIGRLQAGQRQADVAHALNVSQSTISRLWNRFRQPGSTADAPTTGDDASTRSFHSASPSSQSFPVSPINCSGTAWQLEDQQADSEKPYSRSSVEGLSTLPRECADETPAPGQDAVGKPTSDLDSQEPLATFLVQWQSRFLLQLHDGRRRVYRRRGERYAAPCVDEAPTHGGGGVTVWGAISNTGRSQLVPVQGNLTAAQYIQDILQPHVLPLMGTPGAVFQQDNARSHTARITVAYFNNQNIRTLPWPSLSPDLSPIEHLWDKLDRRLRVRNVPTATPDELFAVPVESKGTKSGQFDWSDTLLSRHYRRLLSYSFDFVNFKRSNVKENMRFFLCTVYNQFHVFEVAYGVGSFSW